MKLFRFENDYGEEVLVLAQDVDAATELAANALEAHACAYGPESSAHWNDLVFDVLANDASVPWCSEVKLP